MSSADTTPKRLDLTPSQESLLLQTTAELVNAAVAGRKPNLTDPELAQTYQLFLDVRSEGETAIPSQCRGGGGSSDNNGTVLPWMAVVTYLLADYRFVYE